MSSDLGERTPFWALAVPVVGGITVIGTMTFGVAGGVVAAIVGAILMGVVFSAVYHAEVVAHRIGEPFGTLVLAVAVTVIEVALIVSLMVAGGPDKVGLARDTVFAAVMITCGGMIGLCLLAGGVRHHVQGFQFEGALAALAVLTAMTVLTLIVPNVTVSAPGPHFNDAQLIFAAIVSLVLYGAFVFVQTIRHRDYFLPPDTTDEDAHAELPTKQRTLISLLLLIVALIAVVGLAKALSPTIESAVAALGAPKAVVGVIIAALVLLPEGVAAFRAARLNRLQTSMNLALGSALASIGLTVPAVAIVSIGFGQPLQLGLGPAESVLLALTLLISVITLHNGRTTVLQGIVHLSVFAAFLFYAVVP